MTDINWAWLTVLSKFYFTEVSFLKDSFYSLKERRYDMKFSWKSSVINCVTVYPIISKCSNRKCFGISPVDMKITEHS